jgi:hypothetical protein
MLLYIVHLLDKYSNIPQNARYIHQDKCLLTLSILHFSLTVVWRRNFPVFVVGVQYSLMPGNAPHSIVAGFGLDDCRPVF